MEDTSIKFYPSILKVFVALIFIAAFTAFLIMITVSLFLYDDSVVFFISILLLTLIGLAIFIHVIRAFLNPKEYLIFRVTYFYLVPKVSTAFKIYYEDIDYIE